VLNVGFLVIEASLLNYDKMRRSDWRRNSIATGLADIERSEMPAEKVVANVGSGKPDCSTDILHLTAKISVFSSF
jgi:hypothetical protein